MTDREEFERIAAGKYELQRDAKNEDRYWHNHTQLAWDFYQLMQAARTGDEIKRARENGEDDGFDRAVNFIEPGFGLLIKSLGFDGDNFDGDEDGAFIINKALTWFSELLKPFCFAGTDDEGRLIARTGGEVEAIAKHIENKAEAIAEEHGSHEPDTNAFVFDSADHEDEYSLLHEVAEEIRESFADGQPAPAAAVPEGKK